MAAADDAQGSCDRSESVRALREPTLRELPTLQETMKMVRDPAAHDVEAIA